MKNKVRIAVVGTGYFSKFHFDAWMRLGVNIVAICSLNKKEAIYYSKKFNDCPIYSDFNKMMNEINVDFVDIIIPPKNHLKFIKIAASKNVNIICQKPFTNSYSEALEAVKTELNEVNLLNSKLLYVNRIFKANNLTEAQKLRVVETLDNAENIKEAKLIYETIKDTFVISKDKKTTPKRSIKEGLGMASKAAGTSTASKKPVLNESNDMVTRMQKLANIKISQ